MQIGEGALATGLVDADARFSREPSAFRDFARALLRRKLAVVALIYILLFYTVGVLAPALAPYGYAGRTSDIRKENVYQPPSSKHLLGTDENGRDQFSRIIYAARTTLLITLSTALAGSLFIGTGLGLLAGYARGFIDGVINRAGEVLGSIPSLMLIILLAGTLGPRFDSWIRPAYKWALIGGDLKSGIGDIFFVFLILSLIGWVSDERLIRSQVLAVRETDYVLAALTMGATTGRILRYHVFPNIRHLVVYNITTSLGAVALSEIALSFFGLGVRPPFPSFGQLILNGSGLRNLQAHSYLLIFPGTIAVLFFVAFALLGDALNDVLNPRTR